MIFFLYDMKVYIKNNGLITIRNKIIRIIRSICNNGLRTIKYTMYIIRWTNYRCLTK